MTGPLVSRDSSRGNVLQDLIPRCHFLMAVRRATRLVGRVALVAVVLSLLPSPLISPAIAQGAGPWRFVGPSNVTGPVTALVVGEGQPETLVAAAASGGLWRTTDAARTWQPVSLPSGWKHVLTVARDPSRPDRLYGVSQLHPGLLRSDDGGVTWSILAGDMAASQVSVSSDGRVLLVTTNTGQVWRSIDGGPFVSTINKVQVALSPSDPNRAVAVSYSAGTPPAVSLDGGATWSPAGGTFSDDFWAVSFGRSDPNVVYALTNANVYRSTDAGLTYAKRGSLPHATCCHSLLWVDPTAASRVIVSDKASVAAGLDAADLWLSEDAGATFRRLTNRTVHPAALGPRISDVVADRDYDGVTHRGVFALTDEGVFRTDDIVATTPETVWTAVNTGLATAVVDSVAVAPDGVSVASVNGRRVVRIPIGSTAGLEVFPALGVVTSDPFHAESFYLFNSDVVGQGTSGFWRSRNGGLSFENVPASDGGWATGGQVDPQVGRALTVRIGNTLFRIEDPAADSPMWKSLGTWGDWYHYLNRWLLVNSSKAWIHHCTGIKTFTCNFSSWDLTSGKSTLLLTYSTHASVASADGQIGYAASSMIWKTADGGTSWKVVTAYAEGLSQLALHPSDPDWLFAVTHSGSLIESWDGGATWHENAPVSARVSGLQFSGTTLYAATDGRGIWAISQAKPLVIWPTPAPVVVGTVLGPAQLKATANVPGTFVYEPAAGTAIGAGRQTLSVTFTPTDAVNYISATLSVTMNVPFIGPASGGPGTGTVNAGQTQLTYNWTTYPVVDGKVTFPDCSLYIATTSGLLIPAGAAPDCTPSHALTPVISWANPAPIRQGTALGATQLNASVNTLGTYAYAPPAGTVLASGTQTLSVTFTPTDAVNYTPVTTIVTIRVAEAGEPIVTAIAPTVGPGTGGTAVTITGAGFVKDSVVSIGGGVATGVTVVNDTTITATTPAHVLGSADIVVTNPSAEFGTLTRGFSYVPDEHPADTNGDGKLVIGEVTAYGAAWKQGTNWSIEPNPIPVSYVTRAGYLWRIGETYHRVTGDCPACWMGGLSADGIAAELAADPGTRPSWATAEIVGAFSPGGTFRVTITVTPPVGALAWAVEDRPPAGWRVTNISAGGAWDIGSGAVKWGVTSGDGPQTLEYTVRVPLTSTASPSFSGTVSCDGTAQLLVGPFRIAGGVRMSR